MPVRRINCSFEFDATDIITFERQVKRKVPNNRWSKFYRKVQTFPESSKSETFVNICTLSTGRTRQKISTSIVRKHTRRGILAGTVLAEHRNRVGKRSIRRKGLFRERTLIYLVGKGRGPRRAATRSPSAPRCLLNSACLRIRKILRRIS